MATANVAFNDVGRLLVRVHDITFGDEKPPRWLLCLNDRDRSGVPDYDCGTAVFGTRADLRLFACEVVRVLELEGLLTEGTWAHLEAVVDEVDRAEADDADQDAYQRERRRKHEPAHADIPTLPLFD
jgi:hypothetical protein